MQEGEKNVDEEEEKDERKEEGEETGDEGGGALNCDSKLATAEIATRFL